MTIKDFLSKTINTKWYNYLKNEFDADYFIELSNIIKSRRKLTKVYPSSKDVFNVFINDFDNIKVVILGQDPYYTDGMANGYAFSVPSGITKLPPSLINIFKEIGVENPDDGNLNYLVKQGVFLFNTALTVEENSPNIHKKIWSSFTKKVLSVLNDKTNIVFMLWGGNAISYKKILTNKNNLILESGHPSPLSANKGLWFGNDHFNKANNFLKSKNLNKIQWQKMKN